MMKALNLISLPLLAGLTGCAGLLPAPAERISALPVVTYPAKPDAGTDYVYKLPAGEPIDVRMRADGSMLTAPVDENLSARLRHDLYLYKEWASEDGKSWQAADKLVGVKLNISLPSHEAPGPGEIHLTVEDKPVR